MDRRVLLVLPESPFPPRAGNAWRDLQQVAVLADLGWHVTLAIASKRTDDSEGPAAVPCIQGGLRRSESRPWRSAARAKLSYVVGNTTNPFGWWLDRREMERFVAGAIGEARPDAIVLRSLFVHLIPAIRAVFAGRVIVDCHDADEHLARELLTTVTGLRKVGPWANWRGVRRSMKKFLPQADEVWAVSVHDQRRIAALAPTARVVVIPTGMADLANPSVRPGDGRTLLMTANYHYGPNAQGALWLITEVWPRVVARWPNARLVLAGSGGAEVRREAHRTAGIDFRGFVDDLMPLYDEAAVVAVPVRAGSGTRVKVVDAWRHGKAIVSTAKGIEGLAGAESCVIVADDADRFARAFVRLLADAPLRRELGGQALRLFQRFAHTSIAANFPSHWHTPGAERACPERSRRGAALAEGRRRAR
jgi:glycosyltransferase involved in cell wall biosynthesis